MVTAPARVQPNHNQEGYFLQSGVVRTVSTSSSQRGPSPTDLQSSNNIMLSMLKDASSIPFNPFHS